MAASITLTPSYFHCKYFKEQEEKVTLTWTKVEKKMHLGKYMNGKEHGFYLLIGTKFTTHSKLLVLPEMPIYEMN